MSKLRGRAALDAALAKKPKRHKYGVSPKAERTVDGILFASKAEARRYSILKGNACVSFLLRQVPFHLPGNVKYLLDFMVFWSDGSISYEDVKGMKTPMYRLKRKQVEALYPIKITEVSL